MLHANEAWRQLTGAELQKGVSTGLWESFEFLCAKALVRLSWSHIHRSLSALGDTSRIACLIPATTAAAAVWNCCGCHHEKALAPEQHLHGKPRRKRPSMSLAGLGFYTSFGRFGSTVTPELVMDR